MAALILNLVLFAPRKSSVHLQCGNHLLLEATRLASAASFNSGIALTLGWPPTKAWRGWPEPGNLQITAPAISLPTFRILD
jgi:hypothetical protein